MSYCAIIFYMDEHEVESIINLKNLKQIFVEWIDNNLVDEYGRMGSIVQPLVTVCLLINFLFIRANSMQFRSLQVSFMLSEILNGVGLGMYHFQMIDYHFFLYIFLSIANKLLMRIYIFFRVRLQLYLHSME